MKLENIIIIENIIELIMYRADRGREKIFYSNNL